MGEWVRFLLFILGTAAFGYAVTESIGVGIVFMLVALVVLVLLALSDQI